MYLVKFQKFSLPSIGLCQHLEGKEMGIEGERERDRENRVRDRAHSSDFPGIFPSLVDG